MIIVENLVKKYNNINAMDGISFHQKAGEGIAIMGPSGSGKTTLINLIAGLDIPTSGRILIKGEDLAQMSHDERTIFRRENIGIVFQQFHLMPYLTALENIMLAQYLHSIPDKEEAMQALEKVGLVDRASHLPSQLIGGEQQRVAIARAINNDPPILLADEPTGNLDAKNEALVLDIFLKLKAEGKTVLVVSHNPEVGEAMDKIIRIHHGKIENHEELKLLREHFNY